MTTTIELEDSDEFKHPFYKACYERIFKKKQNILILIVGDPGTGKSLLALRIANQLDPTFTHENIRERVIVQAEQFSQLIAEDGESKLPMGSAVIIDEAGASAMGSRDWYSIGNKMISYILQTFRYRQLILIMTVPNMSFIDVHARKLVNYLIETKKIDFNSNKCKARVWKLDFNKISGESDPFRIRFRQKDEYGETVIIDSMWFKRCNIKIVNAYEKYSHEFKQGIAEKSLKSIIRVKNEADKKEFDIDSIVLKIINNKDKYFKNNGKINRGLVEFDFKVGQNRSRQVISAVENYLSNNSG